MTVLPWNGGKFTKVKSFITLAPGFNAEQDSRTQRRGKTVKLGHNNTLMTWLIMTILTTLNTGDIYIIYKSQCVCVYPV
jgi:hypothetical protein